MQCILDILLKSRAAGKLYEKMFGKIRLQYGMTQLEIDILAFLKNNPGLDTASDIVNYRMLPKANVSQAVEFLIQKGFVGRRTDEQDRRKIHLELLPGAEEAVCKILDAQSHFFDLLFEGMTEKERQQYLSLTLQIAENIRREWESETHGTE